MSELRKAILSWCIGGIELQTLSLDQLRDAMVDVNILTDSDLQDKWGYLL